MKERWAAENVRRQGYNYYWPKYEAIVGRGVKRRAEIKALFPSYLFIETTGQWRVFLSTFGIRGVVLRGESPATMARKIIDDMRERENKDGLIKLPKITPYEKDQKLLITKGPFAGQTGLYDGQSDQQRALLLLNFLGGTVKVLFGKDALQAA